MRQPCGVEFGRMSFQGQMRSFMILWMMVVGWHGQSVLAAEVAPVADAARACLDRGIRYFHSISQQGGYVYYVTTDLTERWGEERLDADTIEVQAPGTPAVGMAYLRAYRVTGRADYLHAAWDAGQALIRGQNDLGGWGHTVRLSGPPSSRISFDDNQTQGAIRFLMTLDQSMDDEILTKAIDKALAMMVYTQLANGGWPHMFPAHGDYHDYATFNDQGINDCIRVMLDAVHFYDNPAYRKSLNRVGRFMMISQLPPPQPGWAQQYNEYLQPAWARDFEPPAVCPLVTIHNLETLMDLYEFTHQSLYLKPIPDALRWLEQTRLPNGLWPRFVAMGTGQALYYDRGRIRVDSPAELHIERRTGYGYENDLSRALRQTRDRFERLQAGDADATPQKSRISAESMIAQVKAILAAQDSRGRWITRNDRFKRYIKNQRWNGEYETRDRISSQVFITHVNRLCQFLELCQE